MAFGSIAVIGLICLFNSPDTFAALAEREGVSERELNASRLEAGVEINSISTFHARLSEAQKLSELLLVENSIIVELKALEKLEPIHEAQLLSYLKLSENTIGLLINFNVEVLKHGIKRRVLNLQNS